MYLVYVAYPKKTITKKYQKLKHKNLINSEIFKILKQKVSKCLQLLKKNSNNDCL